MSICGKYDLYDHICMEKMYHQDPDNPNSPLVSDIMECFIFVLKPDWSLHIQGGFFTWFPAHKAYCALLASICSRSLSDISGCMYGRAGNQTA